jgi:anti-sigma regulatory factor (Ser/Thr protein kinase)
VRTPFTELQELLKEAFDRRAAYVRRPSSGRRHTFASLGALFLYSRCGIARSAIAIILWMSRVAAVNVIGARRLPLALWMRLRTAINSKPARFSPPSRFSHSPKLAATLWAQNWALSALIGQIPLWRSRAVWEHAPRRWRPPNQRASAGRTSKLDNRRPIFDNVQPKGLQTGLEQREMARRQDPQVREFLLENISANPASIASVAGKKFGLSRTAIGGYLARLINEGLVEATGNTRARSYALKAHIDRQFYRERNGLWTEDNVWREDIHPLMAGLNDNIIGIAQYGVTEIVNNVLDHSHSPSVYTSYRQIYNDITIEVVDAGIGIFSKIQQDFKFADARTALLELAKGRLTSDRKNHSGDGIYFTSRMFDRFSILSGHLFYDRTRPGEGDWLVEVLDKNEYTQGTRVIMTININAGYTTRDVFNLYQGEDIHFRTTHIPVVLGRYPGEQLVSRSQAKRILSRVTDFSEVILDFRGVSEIGQAFADEIFRVFQNAHPDTGIITYNTNEKIDKMVHYVRAEKSNVSFPPDGGN